MKNSKRAIIIGASSGIGLELAKQLSAKGYELGLTGRRVELLKQIQQSLPSKSFTRAMDVAEADEARHILDELIKEMEDVDIIIINAGVSEKWGDWEKERYLIDINVTGFVAIANMAMHYFRERGQGQIVGISSVASQAGFGSVATYSASKAFISTYMQGLRQQSHGRNWDIAVTDVRPGFVESEMTAGRGKLFWMATTERACKQIVSAIEQRKSLVYITKRWRLIAWLFKTMPDTLFRRLKL